MDSGVVVVVLVFVLVAIAGLLGAWWYARRLKQDLDAAPPAQVAAPRGTIQLAPVSIDKLRQLTPEPILLKQSAEGVRVQIDHRPMLPLAAFAANQAGGAITEAAAAVTQRYGLKWVVLVNPSEDGKVTVQRLA